MSSTCLLDCLVMTLLVVALSVLPCITCTLRTPLCFSNINALRTYVRSELDYCDVRMLFALVSLNLK